MHNYYYVGVPQSWLHAGPKGGAPQQDCCRGIARLSLSPIVLYSKWHMILQLWIEILNWFIHWHSTSQQLTFPAMCDGAHSQAHIIMNFREKFIDPRFIICHHCHRSCGIWLYVLFLIAWHEPRVSSRNLLWEGSSGLYWRTNETTWLASVIIYLFLQFL
jgi:hypothetical protein